VVEGLKVVVDMGGVGVETRIGGQQVVGVAK